MSEESWKASEARRERAEERALRMTLRRTTLLGQESDLSVRGAEAISLAAQLSRSAWTLSGRPLPECDRAQLEYLFVRRPSAE